MGVTRPRPDPVPVSRYTLEKIGLEIRSAIEDGRGLPDSKKKRGYHSRIAEYLGMSSQQLSHRLSGDYELTIEMVGAIAEFMNAPPGWPFIPWNIASATFGHSARV
jgi:transcriptional regulator with XRE-family HTH domain